jgi:hypothetical protein
MGKSSRIQGYRWAGNPPRGVSKRSLRLQSTSVKSWLAHYGLSAAALPSVGRGPKATSRELLTISQGCLGAAILLTDQRDGSEKVSRLDEWRHDQQGIP